MAPNQTVEEAVEVLQQLGLQEYEARCFVGLTRLPTATAKQLSDVTDVPRTRVYDAIRVLEAQGLVEIQHSSPQQYRAVPIDEAAETLRDQYEDRVERLRTAVDSMEVTDPEEDSPVQEVWALTGADAVEHRTNQLIGEATEEVVLVLGSESFLTQELVDRLNEIGDGTDLIVGTLTESLRASVEDAVPDARTFVSGLDWLRSDATDHDDPAIGRLLLVDRSTILVSTMVPETGEERAIFGKGFGNGMVVIARRLMAQGLLSGRDPGDG